MSRWGFAVLTVFESLLPAKLSQVTPESPLVKTRLPLGWKIRQQNRHFSDHVSWGWISLPYLVAQGRRFHEMKMLIMFFFLYWHFHLLLFHRIHLCHLVTSYNMQPKDHRLLVVGKTCGKRGRRCHQQVRPADPPHTSHHRNPRDLPHSRLHGLSRLKWHRNIYSNMLITCGIFLFCHVLSRWWGSAKFSSWSWSLETCSDFQVEKPRVFTQETRRYGSVSRGGPSCKCYSFSTCQNDQARAAVAAKLAVEAWKFGSLWRCLGLLRAPHRRAWLSCFGLSFEYFLHVSATSEKVSVLSWQTAHEFDGPKIYDRSVQGAGTWAFVKVQADGSEECMKQKAIC